MNCKKGDLAVIVRSEMSPEAVGLVVRCVTFCPARDGSPAWVIDRRVHAPKVLASLVVNGDWWADECLRPIRDNDGEDETLTWAGKPEQVSKPSEVTA